MEQANAECVRTRTVQPRAERRVRNSNVDNASRIEVPDGQADSGGISAVSPDRCAGLRQVAHDDCGRASTEVWQCGVGIGEQWHDAARSGGVSNGLCHEICDSK